MKSSPLVVVVLTLTLAVACQKDNAAGAGSGANAAGASNAAGEPSPSAVSGSVTPGTPHPPGLDHDPNQAGFTLDEALAGLPAGKQLKATFETDKGTIRCDLLADVAPHTVASFVGLARGLRAWRDPFDHTWHTQQPFFDGLAFHRVIPEFMIQGGDPRSRNYSDPYLGTGDPGYKVPDEVSRELKFDRPGRLAMANSGPGTNSGGSQFFITEEPKDSLNGGYTIFGQCDGAQVVKTIARVPTGRANKPLAPIVMRVTITRE